MFNSPFSYFAPSSRQSFYPTRSRGNQRNSFFCQEPNFWEYDQQAAAEQEYRERLAQSRHEEQRRNAYLRRQQQLEEQYRLQQQKEYEQAMLEEQYRLQEQKEREQEMLEEQQRLKQLKAKKEKRRQRKERHLKRIPITKSEQHKPEIEQDKVVHQPNLPKRESEPQSDNDMFFDAFTGNVNESETEHETECEASPASPSYTFGTASDNISIHSSYSSSSESESDSSTYTSTLKTLESKINSNVDVYNRISSAISRDTSTPNTTTLNSRLKVVQRAQIELEKLYEKLDDLAAAPTPEDKQVKQQLTRTAVAYADKTEALFKTIKKLLDEAKATASPKRKILLESVPDEDLSC